MVAEPVSNSTHWWTKKFLEEVLSGRHSGHVSSFIELYLTAYWPSSHP